MPEVVEDGNLHPRGIRLNPHLIKRLFELGGESRTAGDEAQDNQETRGEAPSADGVPFFHLRQEGIKIHMQGNDS